MHLQGQEGERGYAMAALLVSLSVMSVLMGAVLPTWRHGAQREKEAELVFRGEQYARAVALFRSKNGNAFPPSIDVLVQGKYLRKKYVDPITNKEFDVIGAASQAQPQPGVTPPGGRAGVGGRGTGNTGPQGPVAFTTGGQQVGVVSSGIVGVRSKSQDTSIRSYQGQTKYNLWSFVFSVVNRPGSAIPGAANPGGRGGNPAPGGRGIGPGVGTGTSTAPGRGTAPGSGGRGIGSGQTPPFGAGTGRRGSGQ